MQTVIITVPHATCPKRRLDIRHYCDYRASKFAEKLQRALINKSIKVILLKASISRKYCDINRVECRATSFRPKLTKLFCEFKADKENVWLFDVHSFPKKEAFANKDISMLDIAERFSMIPPNIRNLQRLLYDKDIKIKFYAGTKDNDILLEARDWGYNNSTLLEINESIPDNKEDKAISLIVDFILKNKLKKKDCIIL